MDAAEARIESGGFNGFKLPETRSEFGSKVPAFIPFSNKEKIAAAVFDDTR